MDKADAIVIVLGGHLGRAMGLLEEYSCWPDCHLAMSNLGNKYPKHSLCNLLPVSSEGTESQITGEMFMQLCLSGHRAEYMS